MPLNSRASGELARSMRPIALSLAICAAAAVLEGLLAGGGVRQRFKELRLPPLSPSLALWVAIGMVYYLTCFLILNRLLAGGLSTPLASAAFGLLVAIMLFNAGWGYLFFRRKSARASFIALFPYSALVLVLGGLLLWLDPTSLWLLLPYLVYLGYAIWWGYRLWQLNESAA